MKGEKMKNELTQKEIEAARAKGADWGAVEAENWAEAEDYDPATVPAWTPGQWEGGYPARFDVAEDGGEELRDLYEREIDKAASAAWDKYHAAEAATRAE